MKVAGIEHEREREYGDAGEPVAHDVPLWAKSTQSKR
jgi:hypothetical protein